MLMFMLVIASLVAGWFIGAAADRRFIVDPTRRGATRIPSPDWVQGSPGGRIVPGQAGPAAGARPRGRELDGGPSRGR